MLKIFVTGDNHIGKKYDRYPDVKEQLIQSRFDSMRDMVRQAEREGCGLFAVTGDLFDNISTVRAGDVKQAAEILAEFSGTVLVLPGNHDYYTGDEQVWKNFEKALQNQAHNIVLLNEFREYSFDIGDEQAVIYPAFCHSKHSKENNLAWIKETEIPKDSAYRVGIAHGAIAGITPDMKEEYFLMTEKELLGIPVDVWLLGHTHIPYPDLKENGDTAGYKIFNAGTHEQTDLHNNTEGCCFVITLEKSDKKTSVSAHKYVSGRVRYFDLELNVKADEGNPLEERLEEITSGLGQNSVVRVKISGTVKQDEYEERAKIYRTVLNRFLTYETEDSGLSPEITIEKIRSEFSELSFAARFMEHFLDNPAELQMAYELVQQCREDMGK
ncbi:MAG: metallophosphoesterase [Acetatifactor sp.]|nr:metallophosphoesterase [Acetatifactor sp.]